MTYRYKYFVVRFVLLWIVFLQTLFAAPQPRLVKDIDTMPDLVSSQPSQVVNLNGISFFSAFDGTNHGLWRSDGTADGTKLVKEIFPENLITVNGMLLFSGLDEFSNVVLWKSDGTTTGTSIVKKIPYVERDTNPDPGLHNLVNVNGTLFFLSDGVDLWKSDGTKKGTILIKQFINVPDYYSGRVSNLNNVNGTLFFSLGDRGHGTELWKSDGTEAGTTLVKYVQSEHKDGSVEEMIRVKNSLFLTINKGGVENDFELWQSDGTAEGTTLIKESWEDESHTYNGKPSDLTNVNDKLFFSVDYSDNGTELWKSDGTADGTTLVKEFWADDAYYFFGKPRNLTNVNGTLFFTVDEGKLGVELWKSDGTELGTTLVKDMEPGSGSRDPNNLTSVNGTLFFSAYYDSESGPELWKSDGTAAGTVRVKDIRPGQLSSEPTNLTNVNGTLFFNSDDGEHGVELWKSDGTTDGTIMVKDIYFQEEYSTYNLTNLNGMLYFFTTDILNDGFISMELWKSDGTVEGTILVKDLSSNLGYYFPDSPYHLTNMNSTLFFSSFDDINGTELWKSDGTTAGTTIVKDINLGFGNSSPDQLTIVEDTLFFIADDGINGRELWKSDGTISGTTLVKDIVPDTTEYYDYINHLTNVNGTLFFVAYNNENGYELWKSDGSSAGTKLVKDIRVGKLGSSPSNLTNIDGILYFSADDGVNGGELWQSDGTEAGTVMVRNIAEDYGSIPRNLVTTQRI